MNNKELIENSQKKYLIHIGICGFGNQLLGFKEACLIAKRTNRIIVKPIFIPHGTIRDKCRKYYKFDEVFDNKKFSSMFNSCSIDEIKHIKIENIYMNRHENEHSLLSYYLNESEEYYNIRNLPKKQIKKTFLVNYNDFSELNEIEDKILVLVGTFNNVKLNTCSKNGCLNSSCSQNKIFLNDYNHICRSLKFSNYINNLTNQILSEYNLKANNYCAFHLRTSDLCINHLFEDCYNGYNEDIVYQSIVNYLFENSKQNLIDNIFVCLPPQALKIKDLKVFNSNKVHFLDHTKYQYDPFILSIVELNICEEAQILIYSPTNTPHMKKKHTRSSFILHTMDLRRINNLDNKDTCIDKIYNKINLENIKIINKCDKKII